MYTVIEIYAHIKYFASSSICMTGFDFFFFIYKWQVLIVYFVGLLIKDQKHKTWVYINKVKHKYKVQPDIPVIIR